MSEEKVGSVHLLNGDYSVIIVACEGYTAEAVICHKGHEQAALIATQLKYLDEDGEMSRWYREDNPEMTDKEIADKLYRDNFRDGHPYWIEIATEFTPFQVPKPEGRPAICDLCHDMPGFCICESEEGETE